MTIAEAIGRWSAGTGPLYQRLAYSLRAAIERGDIDRGSRLPPERTLAKSLAVSRSTIVAAYDLLRSHGLLESRQGSGTWVAGAAPSRVVVPLEPIPGRTGETAPVFFRSLIEGDSSAISLTAACGPGLPMVSEVLAGIAGEAAELATGHGYYPLGMPALRDAVASSYEERGLPTSPSEIMITSGAQQAIALCAAALVRSGEPVVVESPTYPGALDAFSQAGARVSGVPVGEHGVDTDALRRVVASVAPRATYLIPSAQNPCGTIMPVSARREVARIAADFHVPVIEDEALSPLVLDEQQPPPIAAVAEGAPVITVGSLSKLFWGGLRVGWIRAAEPLIARLARQKTVADLGSSVLGQLAALRLLPRFEEARAQRRAETLEQLTLLEALLAEHLPGWTWRRPAGGAVIWAKMPHGDAREFAQVALRHGVEIVPGSMMSPDGAHAAWVRFPLAATRVDELARAFTRLAVAWGAFAPAAMPATGTLGVLV